MVQPEFLPTATQKLVYRDVVVHSLYGCIGGTLTGTAWSRRENVGLELEDQTGRIGRSNQKWRTKEVPYHRSIIWMLSHCIAFSFYSQCLAMRSLLHLTFGSCFWMPGLCVTKLISSIMSATVAHRSLDVPRWEKSFFQPDKCHCQ